MSITDPSHPEHDSLHARLDTIEERLANHGEVLFGKQDGGLDADQGIVGYLRGIDRRQTIQTQLLKWVLGILSSVLAIVVGGAVIAWL